MVTDSKPHVLLKKSHTLCQTQKMCKALQKWPHYILFLLQFAQQLLSKCVNQRQTEIHKGQRICPHCNLLLLQVVNRCSPNHVSVECLMYYNLPGLLCMPLAATCSCIPSQSEHCCCKMATLEHEKGPHARCLAQVLQGGQLLLRLG